MQSTNTYLYRKKKIYKHDIPNGSSSDMLGIQPILTVFI